MAESTKNRDSSCLFFEETRGLVVVGELKGTGGGRGRRKGWELKVQITDLNQTYIIDNI